MLKGISTKQYFNIKKIKIEFFMKQLKIYVLTLLIPLFGWAQWNQIGNNILGEAANDLFGVNVSISDDGTIIAVGAFNNDTNGVDAGQVKLFKNENGNWAQVGQALNGDLPSENFGSGLSLNSAGNIIAVGAHDGGGVNGGDPGYVKVFENVNGIWTQIGQKIEGEANGDEFGFRLSINDSGTILAVGARSNDANNFSSGHARIFENVNGNWVQIGQDIDGAVAGYRLGSKVSLSGNGDIVAISAIGSNQSRGHVQIHQNIGGAWTQIGQNIDGEAISNLFGQGLALSNDGNTVAIGARFNDSNGTNSGHVKVFKNENENWSQIGQELVGTAAGDNFGTDISFSDDGSLLAVSAGGSGISSLNRGYCIIYRLENNNWTQIQRIDQEAPNDLAGAIELSSNGSTLVIGTYSNDYNGSDSGIARVYGNALLSVEENSFASEIIIYPNPVVHNSTISLGKKYTDVSMQIFDINGKEIMTKTFDTVDEIQVDATLFSSGIYIINLISDTKKASIKMIKR
jgi:Flp pilus assembly pilin Flp